jgi:hypothetical protein
MQRQVAELTRSQYSGLVVDFIFSRPIFATTHFVEGSHIPRESALRILRVLRTENVLSTIREGAGRRPSILAFPDLLNIAEGKDVL